MNILMLSWRDPKHPLAGGAEQVMHKHAKGWIKAGHKVTLYSSYFIGAPREEVLDGVNIIRGGNPYLGVQILAWRHYREHSADYDILVDQFHGYPFFAPLYSKQPILAVIQETARKVWFLNPLPHPLNYLVGIIGYLTEPLIFLLYQNTAFMTGSNSALEDLSRMGIPKANIHIVPHGVIIKKPKNLPPKERINTVSFLGVLSRDKGIEDALKCFAILNGKGRFQFWVIGRAETPKYGDHIKNLAESYNLAEKVKFWGFVSQEDKFLLLAKSHLLINPSVHEGWGLVNIEANAVATPVVAYKSSGLVDSVKDGVSGVLVKENTPESLAQSIIELFADRKRYERLSRSSISWSKNFSWDKSAKLSLMLIRKVVSADL